MPGHPPARGGTPPKPSGKARSARPEQRRETREVSGPKGPEPTRYGDWERNGRCVDF